MAYYRPQQSWRDHYNPLRGLSMARIVAMEEAANRGDQADLQWFWNHMHTDVTVSSAINKRLSHVTQLDWEIRAIETADPVLAAEQADVLRYAYDRIENLVEAATHLAYAHFTGQTILEKIPTGYGNLIKRLEYIPPWFWNYDKKADRWLFNEDARSGSLRGEVADPQRLVIHNPDNPAFQAIGRNFFSKQLALADWDLALENGRPRRSITSVWCPRGTADSMPTRPAA